MTESVLAALPKGLPDRQARFLVQLARTPALSRRDYETLAGICDTTAQRDLAELLAAGLIVRYGRARAARYSITPGALKNDLPAR